MSYNSIIRFEEVGVNTLSRAEKLLAGFPGGLEKATKSAMSRALSHLRTNSTKAIRQKFAISEDAIRTEENIKISYSYTPGNGVSGSVMFSGHKIPLYRYNGTFPVQPTQDTSKTINALIRSQWQTTYPGVAARGHQFNSTSPAHFEEAFVARVKAGDKSHIGIFERTGGMTSNGNEQIEEKMGSAVAQMVGNKDVREALVEEAMKKFDERLDHEVLVILNGWR